MMGSMLPVDTRLLRGLLLVAMALPGVAGAADAPRAVVQPARGFIDDGFVISPQGDRLYYVATDGATWAELHAAALPEGKDVLLAADVPISVARLSLLPEERVLAVQREEGGRESATVYDAREDARAPRSRGRVGPASAIDVAQAAGGPAVVALTRPEGGRGEYRITAVAAATLRPLGQHAYRLRGGSEEVLALGEDGAAPLYWTDHLLGLVVRQAGAYDRKNDIRQPDHLALIDPLSGKARATAPIADPTAVAELAGLRAGHPGEPVFVRWDSEGPGLELVGREGAPAAEELAALAQRAPLPMPRQMSDYDPATLQYQAAGPRVFFSLTVDPLNPGAVRRQKRDPDILDLCVVDPAHPAPRRVAELPGKGRPARWFVTPGGRLGLLRKHKGFSRGGTEIEIHDLALGPS